MVDNEGKREEIDQVDKSIVVVVNSYCLGYIQAVGTEAYSMGCKDNKTS